MDLDTGYDYGLAVQRLYDEVDHLYELTALH